MYSVLLRLNVNPLDSNVSLHNSNLALTPALVSSISTISSANSIHHENFFQAAGEIRDVSFAVDADDRFKGYCRVEFITAEAAEKAVEYNGDYLNDCQLRICLAHERVAYTPHSCEGNSSSPKEGRGRAHTVFMKGLDNFLGEDQV
ncbi:uncharacterized protein J3R85_001132 [Psidium guajava]|nr:uncharacterized protein J3R85_001132 [Psidium guajava]